MRKNKLFYGWVVVAVAHLTLGIRGLPRSAFSIFYLPMIKEFGWTRAMTSLGLSMNLITHMVAAPTVGFLIDGFGPKRILVSGAIAISIGLLATGQTYNLLYFYIVFGMFTSFGVSALGFPIHTVLISNWFQQKRTTAIGIAFGGTGVIAFIFLPLTQYIMSWVGWRGGFIFLSLWTSLFLLPLLIIFQKDNPQEMELLPDGKSPSIKKRNDLIAKTRGNLISQRGVKADWTLAKATKTLPYWYLFMMQVFIGINSNFFMNHAIPFMVDKGYTKILAATIYGSFSLLNAFGNISGGYIADRIGMSRTYLFGTLSGILGIFIFMSIKDNSTPWMLYAFLILYGFGNGIGMPTLNNLQAEIFYGKNFGSIAGSFGTAFGIGGALGPFLGGYVYDKSGSYYYGFLMVIFTLILANIFVYLISRNIKTIPPRNFLPALKT